MQAEQLQHNESVAPIEYHDIEREAFTLRHMIKDADLIVQIFCKASPVTKAETPTQVGGRVAKAVVDTVGEDAMREVTIEMYDDPALEHMSAFVKFVERGSKIMTDLLVPRLTEHLEETLVATRA
jgi:hypothetical protein